MPIEDEEGLGYLVDPGPDEDPPQSETPEELAARLKAEFEEEFKQHKSNYGRRFTVAQQQLKERGLTVDESGNVGVVDPRTAAAWFMGANAGQVQEPAPEVPDPMYEPDKYREFVTEQAVRRSREEASRELADLKAQIQSMQAMLQKGQMPGVVQGARQYLSEMGLEAFANEPEFDGLVQEAYRGVPPEMRDDPMSVNTAALFAMAALQKQKGITGRGQAPAGGQRQSAPLRQAAGIGPSRGVSAPQARQEQYSEAALVWSETTGQHPSAWDALEQHGDADQNRIFEMYEKRHRNGARR